LYKEIEGGKYDKAFYDYFINIDLTNFDFTNERPITSFYSNMKELNIPIMARFFESIVDEDKKINNFSSTELFNKFNDYVKANNFKADYTATKFGIDIKSYDGVEKVKTRTNNVVNIDLSKLKSHLISKYKIEFVDFIEEEIKEEIKEEQKEEENIEYIEDPLGDKVICSVVNGNHPYYEEQRKLKLKFIKH
jgi:hypothetical protein